MEDPRPHKGYFQNAEEQRQQLAVTVARLDERMKRVEDAIDKIMNNHLVHLSEEIVGIRLKLAYWSGATIVCVSVIQFVLNKYFE